MADIYEVKYNITVNDGGAATKLNLFATAVQKLVGTTANLEAFERRYTETFTKLSKLATTAPKMDVDTSAIHRKLDKVVAKLEKIGTLAARVGIVGAGTASGSSTSGSGSKKGRRKGRGDMGYRVLGPSMLDSGGTGLVNIIKGMGMGYGIAAGGSLIASTLSEAVEYDNLMQTAKNILSVHDKRSGFEARFHDMEQNVRNVGVETKFSSAEVANAAKFLAMAGLGIEEINASIRPIADIALIGDTSLGETADLVTNVMTGYGIAADQMRHAADVMTMTFTSANVTLPEIAEAYKYSASLLSAGGVSFEEATAALGVLGNAGIKGSQGGTSLRTILANIVNPRSIKREKAWREVGVERFDANGNMRDMIDIFRDLRDKNLDVATYYRLFDRTAAQAAVGLAANVEEWNKIVIDNFLSEGVAARLAEKKKNTIQGLWYQLTSTFTEQGLKIFEEMNAPIREFMDNVTKQLASDDFRNVLTRVSKTVFNLMEFLIPLTKIVVGLFSQFSGAMAFWLKFQMIGSMILVPMRIFRGLSNIGKYLGEGATKLSDMTFKLGMFNRNFKLSVQLKERWASIKAGVMDFWNAPVLDEKGDPILDEKGKPIKQGVLKLRGAVGIGASAGLGALGAYWGSTMGEPGSFGNFAATVGGGAAGSLIGSVITTSAGLYAALAAALVVGGVELYRYTQRVNESTKASLDFISATKSMNGINLSSAATTADKYLGIIYNKQLSVNQLLGEHIKLVREQLGLMDTAASKNKDLPFKESHKKEAEDFAAPWSSWAILSAPQRQALAFKPIVDKKTGKIDHELAVYDVSNGGPLTYQFNGVNYSPTNRSGEEALAVARKLYSQGRDLQPGSKLNELTQEYNNRIFQATSLEAIDGVLKDLDSLITSNTKSIIKDSQNWTVDDWQNATVNQHEHSYHFVSALNKGLTQQFDYNTPGISPSADRIRAYRNILKAHETGTLPSEEDLFAFLRASGVVAFDERFAKFGTEGWLKQMGYWDNKWHEVTHEVFDETTEQWRIATLSADEAQKAVLEFYKQIYEVTSKLLPQIAPYFAGILRDSVWDIARPPVQATYNGITYQYDKNTDKWNSLPPALPSSMSNNEMQKHLRDNVAQMKTDGIIGNMDGSDNRPGPGDYKSKYSSSSAAPKQVNVHIESLMNVESIDMADPNNAAVIDNLKERMAQVLIDVVRDLDDSYHSA